MRGDEPASSSYAPLDGELIYDKTANNIKVGDGSSSISNLNYISSDGKYIPFNAMSISIRDLDILTTSGAFTITNHPTNAPDFQEFYLWVINDENDRNADQIAFSSMGDMSNTMAYRKFNSDTRKWSERTEFADFTYVDNYFTGINSEIDTIDDKITTINSKFTKTIRLITSPTLSI